MKNLIRILFYTILITHLAACLPEKEEVSVETAGSGDPEPGFQTLPDNQGQPDANTDGQNGTATGTITASAIMLNHGDPSTSQGKVLLSSFAFEALEMKVSLNATCDGGTWVVYDNEIELDVPANMKNGIFNVSARFSDYDNRISRCFAASILHDDVGPEILFAKYPVVAVLENTAVELIYSVQDAGVGVDRVRCTLNNFSQNCSAGRTIVNVPGAAPGSYTFEIVATDKQGIESRASVTWLVTSRGSLITHNLLVPEYRKWDILIVDDNSGSMAYEQTSMASRTRNFLSILRGLDWQIAVTTTDPRAPTFDKKGKLVTYVGGDGDFIELKDSHGQYILKANMYDEATAQTLLSQTLQRPETGSGSEQGIRSTYRVIERATAGGTGNALQAQFVRSDANLAVVLISDEDESANTTKNNPQGLMDLIKAQYSEQKNFIFNSIITIPGDKSCLDGQGETYGERYKILTQMTGGLMGSVCEMDYAAQMTGIAENIRNMAKSFTLNCLPLAEYGVSVTLNGAAVTIPFTLDGLKLTFAQAIDPGAYQLKYYCLNP